MADTEPRDPINPLDVPAPVELPLTRLDTAFATFLSDAQPSPDARHRLLAALTCSTTTRWTRSSRRKRNALMTS